MLSPMLLIRYHKDTMRLKLETAPNIRPPIGYHLSQIISQLKN